MITVIMAIAYTYIGVLHAILDKLIERQDKKHTIPSAIFFVFGWPIFIFTKLIKRLK